MAETLTLQQLRDTVEESWKDLESWFVAKPRLFALPHPEQQIAFELAARLRDAIRQKTKNTRWDRLFFDGAALSAGAFTFAETIGRRPPIYLDTRQIFGVLESRTPSHTEPDAAIAVHVLRSSRENLTFDPDGRPKDQTWLPASLRSQGWLIEEQVRHLQQLADRACEGWLFAVYSNEARRVTAVDAREVASWASWQKPTDTLWWTSRHFRAKPVGAPR